MTLMNSSKNARNMNTIINRTEASGGSNGGIKKAGFGGLTPYMRIYNIGHKYHYRVPQKMQLNMLLTNNNPLQYRRGSYSLTHTGTLLG